MTHYNVSRSDFFMATETPEHISRPPFPVRFN